MIVKNEEKRLPRCLECVKHLVDEIIIVDTGSEDNTKAIALSYTDKVFEFEWIDDFSAARNFAFSKATQQYIMWLDADDVIGYADQNKLRDLKKRLGNGRAKMVMAGYQFLGPDGKPNFKYMRERIFKRTEGYKWQDPVHEFIPYIAEAWREEFSVTHLPDPKPKSDRNLRIYKSLIVTNNKLTQRQQYYYARELYEHGHYVLALAELNEFLKMPNCQNDDKIDACLMISRIRQINGNHIEAMSALFDTFKYGLPKPDIACEIGYLWMHFENWKHAAFWFKMAYSYEDNNGVGFYNPDCKEFIPAIELVVCYSNMKDYKEADEWLQKAAEFKPTHSSVQHNREFLKQYLETI